MSTDSKRCLALAESEPGSLNGTLQGSGVALLFEKASNRTRNSTEMAVGGLGGHPVYIRGEEVGLDVRESAADVARTLACYHAVVCARVVDHPPSSGWPPRSTAPRSTFR